MRGINRYKLAKFCFGLSFVIALPIYLFCGFQPTKSVDASGLPTLNIPSIALETPVQGIELIDKVLESPAKIAGWYSHEDNKTLIIGHSSTVFHNLDSVQIDDTLSFNDKQYIVTEKSTVLKSSISMNVILAGTEEDTVIIMTCAGQPLPGQDATHRLLITAVATN